MSKKKRKRKGYNCSDVAPEINTDCGPELSIATRMRIFGSLPWLATDIEGKYIYGYYTFGYFERIVIYDKYQFEFHICMGMN